VKPPLETRALGWALTASLFSLSGAWLAALLIQMMPSSGAAPTSASSPASASEIVVSPELATQGHEFFEMSCSQCHGDDAHGDEGPDLHNLSISNARIAATIKKGIKGEMPTFANKYNDPQIAALVSYIRSLR
jgi:mono/diheme cytochrome c family protein